MYLQKVAFSFEKSSNGQNYSSPGCHHRIKESFQENFRSEVVWGREVSNYGLDGPEDDKCLPKSAFGLHQIPASVTKAASLKIFAAEVSII